MCAHSYEHHMCEACLNLKGPTPLPPPSKLGQVPKTMGKVPQCSYADEATCLADFLYSVG